MTDSLISRQKQFAQMAALLVRQAFALGFDVTLGDAYRDPRCSYGAAGSLHRFRLAIDLNLFSRSGQYLTGVEDHRPLGEWWEAQGGSWGGRFVSGPQAGDANHYSLEWEGRR